MNENQVCYTLFFITITYPFILSFAPRKGQSTNKQDSQYKVAVEKQWVLHNLTVGICSLRHPACNGHRHIVICGLPRYTIFFHFTSNGTILGKKRNLLNKKCVTIFSTNFVWNIFHSNMKWSSMITRYSSPILMKLEFSWQTFEEYSNIKFHDNPPSGGRVVPGEQTDGRIDMT